MIPYAWSGSAMFTQRSAGWRTGAPIDQSFLINILDHTSFPTDLSDQFKPWSQTLLLPTRLQKSGLPYPIPYRTSLLIFTAPSSEADMD